MLLLTVLCTFKKNSFIEQILLKEMYYFERKWCFRQMQSDKNNKEYDKVCRESCTRCVTIHSGFQILSATDHNPFYLLTFSPCVAMNIWT